MSFTHRLDIYGPAECVCGNRVESVFTRLGTFRELVCRNHPGHPLYEGPEAGAVHESTKLPVPQLVGV